VDFGLLDEHAGLQQAVRAIARTWDYAPAKERPCRVTMPRPPTRWASTRSSAWSGTAAPPGGLAACQSIIV